MKPRIFLDMDGVLTDFVGHALKFHGSDMDIKDWPTGEWDIAKVLGLGPKAFWSKLDCREFWMEMPLYDHAEELLQLCKDTGFEVVILSSPARGCCASCKLEYAHENFFRTKVILANDKTPLAHSVKTLLIDDHDGNHDKWTETGGFCHIFPRKWNFAHAQHDHAMEIITPHINAWANHVKLLGE